MAKLKAGIEGVKEVIRTIKRRKNQLSYGVEAGLQKAGNFLIGESMKKVPVEFGELIGSAYVRVKGRGFKRDVEVGYTAPYALYVHEAVGMKLKGLPRRPSPPHIGRYWDPQGRAHAKFLEEPARRLLPELRRIILTESKKWPRY